MKIFRWLFSNLFFILLIVVVIYSYMYWGNLAGRDTPAGKTIAYLSEEFVEVEDFFHAIKEKQAELADKQLTSSTEKVQQAEIDTTSGNNASESIHNTEIIKTTDKKVDALAIAPAPEANKAIPSPETTTNKNVSNHLVAEAPHSAPVIAPEKNSDVFVPAEVESQLNNVNERGKIINETRQKSSDVRSTWITARKSFYQRNYALSEQSYLKVIESTEDNFDAYGELGNVYYNQGKNRQAASAYFEAAAIMIRKGQARRAKSLLGLLNHLDRSKAEELQKLIDAVNS